MRPRHRAAGILAVLGAGTLLLSAAVPSGAPALFNTPAGFDSAKTPDGQPIVQTSTEPPPGAVAPKTAIQELRTMGSLQLDSSGTVRSITAAPGESLGTNGDAFVKRYAGAFGLTKSHSLVRSQAVGLPGGDQVVRYQQTAGGIPVLGGEVVLTTTSNGSVRGAITDTTPLAPSGGAAKLDPAAAQSKALTAATATYEIDPATVSASSALWLYSAPGKAQLRPTYWVKLAEHQHEIASVLVDAIDGSIKLVASEHQAAKKRAVCDAANVPANLNSRLAYVCNEYSALGGHAATRLEGEPVSSSAEVNMTYDRLGVAYDYFKNNFGRDSYDGRGEQIRATVRACHISCPFHNAFWEGYQFVFGQGWATDDVVAHEYTHAVTEHASSLYYWHQSGAINEALSDIFGEFIDLSTSGDGTDDTAKRWQMGEDLPADLPNRPAGAIRNLMDPHQHGDPAYYREYPYWSETYDNWDNGGVHTNSGPANRMAALIADGSAADGITGIGLSKSAQLWYRIMHMLSSGANYEQLVVTAKAACRQLINKGMTVADCDTVTKATTKIFPNYQPSEDNLCDDSPSSNLGQRPFSVLFSDDMEQGGAKWNRSDSYFWQFIPNTQIDYTYAAHGRGSLNGWTAPGTGQRGHGTSAELADWVNIPSGPGLTPWVSFNYSAIQNGVPNGNLGVEAFINNGSGWAPLSLEGMGNRMSSSTGYWYKRANLSAYAGQSVKVKFQVVSPSNTLVDWYLDDFTIFNCQYARPGAPQDAFAYLDGTDLKITWATYLYNADPRNPQNHHFEFTYSPAIPGAPETYRATPAQADDLRDRK
ncbi:MAG TPA: hypothetical protein DGG94_11085, partial [Micromonosporaceae bacterium]|nr:hypothetical protein [Micromonosporaceae bacterium]